MELPKQDILSEMEEYAGKHDIPIIRKDGAEFLIKILTDKKPFSILEVGTAIGYSAILMAQNNLHASIVTIEKDEERFLLANKYIAKAGVSQRITTLLGDADEILPTLIGNFDAVFIDAAKGHYLSNLMAILNKLENGAVIIADNVLFRGWVVSDAKVPRRYRTIVKRLKAYLDYIQNDSAFDTTIYDIGDGIAVSYYGGKN